VIRRASRRDMLRMIDRITKREGKGATLEQLRVAMELAKNPTQQLHRLKLAGLVEVTYEGWEGRGRKALVTLTDAGVALIGGGT
jgi:hypothetical protein